MNVTTNQTYYRKHLQKLPPLPEPELAPSVPVYNESGKRAFVVVEISLLRPLMAKRNPEDLTDK